MDLKLEALSRVSATDRMLHRPEFFRLSLPADRERLQELLKRAPALVVNDELLSQLAELVRARHPSVKFTKQELTEAAKSHLGAAGSEEYGVWVHYPWSGRLVHLLDEVEFALVRTDRNRNKITREEQERLSMLRIGVVGLSVGQSICLTLALERGFGELRIADYDTLDLSNLNRIRSGVQSLGNLKTVNVAREIAEIDPFLKVTLFNEGITRENIDAFLTDGGKLDILVDECDSVDVKILCRQRAKAHRIPVIMDTSDRGMLDVERFDLEPDRPILHGLIDHLNPDDAAKAKTNEEKLPFVLPVLNVDTLSKRMKASMLEIESSLTTWPQLASSVVLGGALGADITRRIALDQFRESGRWFVDLEELVTDSQKADMAAPALAIPDGLGIDQMVRAAELVVDPVPDSIAMEPEIARRLVRAAALAPSGGNSQPWRFLLYEGRLLLFMDPARAFSTIDPGGIYAHLALGCCLENLRLEAGNAGLSLNIRTHGSVEVPELIATIGTTDSTETTVQTDPLSAVMALRCTNRRVASDADLDSVILEELRNTVTEAVPEALVQIVTERPVIEKVAALCGAAERVRMLNPLSHLDMFSREMRWTPAEAERSGDGVDIRTLDLGLSDRTGISVAADAEAVAMLRDWKVGRGFEKFSRKVIATSAAIALVRIPGFTRESTLEGGRAVQRLWLAATKAGLAVQPISAPVFMGLHERFDRRGLYSVDERKELSDILNGLRSHFPAHASEPFFLLRLGHAEPPSVRSLRRPLNEFFHIHQPVHA